MHNKYNKLNSNKTEKDSLFSFHQREGNDDYDEEPENESHFSIKQGSFSDLSSNSKMNRPNYPNGSVQGMNHPTDLNFLARKSDQDEDFNNFGKSNLKSSIRWVFWIEMLLVLGALFVAESSRGIVVPSLYLFVEDKGGDKQFLGFVVAAFSVGRLFGANLYGYWFDKRGAKESLIGSLILSLIGNLLYSFSGVSNKWMILASRTIVGFGTGVLSVIRAYVGTVTTKEERTRFMAYTSVTQFLGFALMPIVGAGLATLDFHVGKLPVNRFTAPGYFLAIINLLTTILVFFFLRNIKPEPPATKEEKKSLLKKESSPPPKKKDSKLVIVGALLFIFFNFVVRGVIALIETVASPLFLEVWKTPNPVQDTAYMLSILGVFGLVIYFTIDYILKIIPNHVLLAIGFAFTGVGALLLLKFPNVPMTLAQFLAGSSLIWSLGSPITQVLIISTFSLILGSKPQGNWMGYMASAGSIGRIVFPLFAGKLEEISFIISAILCFVIVITIFVYRRLVEREQRNKEIVVAESLPSV